MQPMSIILSLEMSLSTHFGRQAQAEVEQLNEGAALFGVQRFRLYGVQLQGSQVSFVVLSGGFPTCDTTVCKF